MIESFSTILLLAGSSTRCELGYNKVLHLINNKPIFMYSLEKFLSVKECTKVVVVCKKEEEKIIKQYISNDFSERITFAYGGLTRQDSVFNGLEKITEEYVLIHDGARPFITTSDIKEVFEELKKSHLVTLASKCCEALRYVDDDYSKSVERNKMYSIKTPQGLMKSDLIYSLKKAEEENISFYDDVSAVEKYIGISPKIVVCKNNNIKITENEDVEMAEKILKNIPQFLIGHSCDTHRLESGDFIILGGEKITCEFRVVAHSDGDALYHSIAEALLGALSKGDLGTWFPDNDPKYKGIASKYFLIETAKMVNDSGYEIVNIDSTIYIEKPMMTPFISKMKNNISDCLNIDLNQINVKATRGEKVGPIGESKAVMAETVLLLKKK